MYTCHSTDTRLIRIRAAQRLQGKYAGAEPLYKRSQTIREKALGSEHPLVAELLQSRAVLAQKQVRAVRIL